MLNIAAYHFVAIDDAPALAASIRAGCAAQGLRGSVLVAPEGINLFLAGEDDALRAFLRELTADARFAGLIVKYSRSRALPFRRLRVKLKPAIISFRHEHASPLATRAPTVEPATLARWLASGVDDDGRAIALVDTRNAQETAHGSFAGALTLPIVKFDELPAALEPHREALRGKTIVSFCTGGIRCEKAAVWMAEAGFEHVLQLEGGILNYFEQVGGEHYDGRCFVFDERVALDPQLRPLVDAAAA